MKKTKLFAALLCSASLIIGSAVPAMADSVRVVTLGADLTQDQKDTMMRYFKVGYNDVQILSITNEDEREHLSAYVPLEQIGTRTVSCAYVKPTTSGGIKVRTANLNWVTCNMIATTLSTSGVKNCEVVAACPFEVSGTGALTGIQMAYETASGEQLDETKKEIATEEMVITGSLAEKVGQNDATTVINQAKMQVIQNGISDPDEIYNLVLNIAEQNNVLVSAEELDKIVALLVQIAEQDYDYEDVKDTLENVDQNVNGDGAAAGAETGDDDSILSDLDEGILGSDVIAGSTEDPTVGDGFETGDEYSEELPEGDEEYVDEGEYVEEGDDTVVVGGEDDTEDQADELSEQAQYMYDQAKLFCKGEFEGDVESLQSVMGSDAYASVYMDEETGKKVSEKVLDAYMKILSEGTGSFVPSDTDTYMNPELNMMKEELKKLFGIDGETLPEGETDVLVDYTQDDKELLYAETLKFFETVYGEVIDTVDTSMDESMDETESGLEETDGMDGMEESYEEDGLYEENYDEILEEEIYE